MKKRLLSLLLAIVMVVGLIPAMVIGVGAEGEPVLPEGYLELEYLEFPKGAILDTGFVFDSENVELYFESDGEYPNFCFGSNSNVDKNALVCYNKGINSGTTGKQNCNNNFLIAGRHTYKFIRTDNAITIQRDGANIVTNNAVPSGSSIINTDGNAFRYGSTSGYGSGQYFTGKLYSLSLKSDGDYVRNYIPCVRLSDYTAGFYDTVANTFAESTATAFSYPREALISTLPSGYTLVDGVWFDSGAILDTGIFLDSENVLVDFDYSGKLGTFSFGSGANKDGNLFTIYTSYFVVGSEDGTVSKQQRMSHGTDIQTGFKYNSEVRINRTANDTKIDLFLHSKTGTVTCKTLNAANEGRTIINPNNNTFRFGLTSGYKDGNASPFTGILNFLVINVDNVCKGMFFPCVEEATGDIGFIDTVTGGFFKSSSAVPFKKVNLSLTEIIDIYYLAENGTHIPAAHEVSANGALLYLPSNADYADMTNKLILPEGTVLTGTQPSASLTVGEDSLDLTELFGAMSAGQTYTLHCNSSGVEYGLMLIKSENIADLYIDCDQPLTYLNANKANTASGTLVMNDSGIVKTVGLSKIKGRGNTSWNAAKKGYNITLDEKTELIAGANKQKKYCLLAYGSRGYDFTYAMAAFTLFEQLGEESIDWRPVNLYVNGECLGYYLLTEKVQIDENVIDVTEADMTEGTRSRTVNASTAAKTPEEQALLNTGIKEYKYSPDTTVTSDGGFVIEAGYYYTSDACGFKTSHGNTWSLKEPEYVSLEQMTKIASYVQAMEDAVFSDSGYNTEGKHYSEYLDLDSIARAYLVRSYLGEQDFFITSTYLTVDGDDSGLKGKMYSGPLWDFDWCTPSSAKFMGISYGSASTAGANQFGFKLMHLGEFVDVMREINETEFVPLVHTMINGSDTTPDTVQYYKAQYDSARKVDDLIWEHNLAYYSTNYKNALISKEAIWESIWSDTTGALRGVTAADVDGTLTATATGATGYQWYKVDTDGYTGVAVDGATNATFTPAEDGTYYVVATGAALAGTTATSMTSNAVEFAPADPKLSGSNVKKSLSPLENININFKVVNDETNDISQYIDFVLVVEDSEGNEVTRVDDWKWQGNTRYWCALPVLPQDINTVYNIHIEAKNKLGEDVHGETFEYGVCTYCDNQIAKPLGDGITEELKDFCTAIKVYGAAAKAYFEKKG